MPFFLPPVICTWCENSELPQTSFGFCSLQWDFMCLIIGWCWFFFFPFFFIFCLPPHTTPNPHRLLRHTAWSLSLWGWSVWSLEVPLQRWQSTLWLTRYSSQPSSLQLQHTPGYTAAPWPHPLLQPPTALFPTERVALYWRIHTNSHTHTASHVHMPKASLQRNPHQNTQPSAV